MLFLLTFFPKNIIRLQFCALASFACWALSVSLRAHCGASVTPGLLIHHGHMPAHSLSLGRGLVRMAERVGRGSWRRRRADVKSRCLPTCSVVCRWRVRGQKAWVASGTRGLWNALLVWKVQCVWPHRVTGPGDRPWAVPALSSPGRVAGTGGCVSRCAAPGPLSMATGQASTVLTFEDSFWMKWKQVYSQTPASRCYKRVRRPALL